MKYLGQYIQQFISRFRNDVFLEDVSSGTIVSGGNLGLDSNNKIVKATISSTTDLASDVTGVLPVANGGTGSSSAGGAITNLGLNNANIITSGTLDVDVGGTGATSLTDNAVLLGNGTSAIEASAHLTYSNFAPGGGVDIDQLTIGDASSTGGQVLTPGTIPMTVGPSASSGSNVAGASLTLQGGQSTGNAAGGSIRFLSSVTGSSGSVPNSTAEIAAFDNVGNLQLDGGITTGSTSFVDSSGIIQTAAQTNITSVGTLTGLTTSGAIELGHASDTTIARSAAGKVTIEGANVQTTQICCTHHNMSLDGSSSTVDYYFPINSLADGSSSGLYYTRVVAAYDGKIVKILLRGNSLPEGSSSNSFGTNSVIYMSRRDHDGSTYYHQTSGFQASETFNGSSQSTIVVPCGVGGANAADWVFEEGDVLGFSLVKNTTATDIDLAATIVWEYTV